MFRFLFLFALLLSACTNYLDEFQDQYGDMVNGAAATDLSNSSANLPYGLFEDARDGQSYMTVTIGDQIWLAQNLNYNDSESYCYDDEPTECVTYGRLYTWAAAQKACPAGWHLPSKNEWDILFTTVGGLSVAGAMLKSSSGWENDGNGTDNYSFTVRPAGYRDTSGHYGDGGNGAYFWTSTEGNNDDAYRVKLKYYADVTWGGNFRNAALSVRCLMGEVSGNGSSSVVKSSSSSAKSSNSAKSSSSVKTSTSSSSFSAVLSNTLSSCGDLWCGKRKGEYRVNTGLDAGGDLSGWWWDYNDSQEEGYSSISWAAKLGNDLDPKAFDHIIDKCSGICGTANLDRGNHDFDPYVGFGFHVAGPKTASGTEKELVDISEWGGLCVVYSSDVSLWVQLGLGDYNEKALYAYDIPYATLPKGYDIVLNLEWSDFHQQGWGVVNGAKSITGPQAAKSVQDIKIKIMAPDGNYKFNVASIGRLGSCGGKI